MRWHWNSFLPVSHDLFERGVLTRWCWNSSPSNVSGNLSKCLLFSFLCANPVAPCCVPFQLNALGASNRCPVVPKLLKTLRKFRSGRSDFDHSANSALGFQSAGNRDPRVALGVLCFVSCVVCSVLCVALRSYCVCNAFASLSLSHRTLALADALLDFSPVLLISLSARW